MKKAGILIGIVLLAAITLSFVSAAKLSPDVAINNAYQCLSDKTVNKTDLSLQEAVFSTLALGYQNTTNLSIESNGNANCWPKSGCTLKDSAQVALAYDRIWKNNSNVQKWLISKNSTVADLQWYLEIDAMNHGQASCTINDGSSSSTVTIGPNMMLSGSAGSCLGVDSSGYFLRVGQNCLDKTFTVSCDQDFISTLLYKKAGGSTYYVSSDTHGSPSQGSTEEKINAKCFKTGNTCDYEGTLWTAFALQQIGYDVTPYMPYILALADDNAKFFPSAFIYLMAGGNDQYSSIVSQQKQTKFWQIANNSMYYDTSLAMMSLAGSSSGELQNSKQYLLDIQPALGCWNNGNIRDTGFVLYSGWPREVTKYPNSSGPNCPIGETRVGGVCTPIDNSCPAGQIRVSGICVDNNITCNSTQTLVNGTCVDNNPSTVTNGALSLSIISPTNGANYNASFLVNISVANASGVLYTFDKVNRTYTGEERIPLANGSYTLTAFAFNASVTVSQSVNFVIANSDSTVTICRTSGDCASGQSCQAGLCKNRPTYYGGSGNYPNGTSDTECSRAKYTCSTFGACTDAGGIVLSSYACTGSQACCSIAVVDKTCKDLGGIVCTSNQKCSGSNAPSSDGSCCMSGACINVEPSNSCESSGIGNCRSSCFSGEKEISQSCSAGEICCSAGNPGVCSTDVDCLSGQTCNNGSCVSPSSSYTWLWILMGILIILSILGIVYKDKIRLWIFKMQGKIKSNPLGRPNGPAGGIITDQQRRPMPFGGLPMRTPMGIRPAPAAARPPVGKPASTNLPQTKKPEAAKSKKDSEFEETLKKLREMSK